MGKVNFLQETLYWLKENKIEQSEIICVSGDGVKMTWEQFKACANFEYDAGCGSAEIRNIIIHCNNCWLERAECNGSEWWKVRRTPAIPEKYGEFKLRWGL